MSNLQTETIAAITITESAGLVELSDDDLDVVAGGAHQASGSTYDRHRLSMKGSSFAGPDGAGSTFSMQEEDVHSSSFEMQDDC